MKKMFYAIVAMALAVPCFAAATKQAPAHIASEAVRSHGVTTYGLTPRTDGVKGVDVDLYDASGLSRGQMRVAAGTDRDLDVTYNPAGHSSLHVRWNVERGVITVDDGVATIATLKANFET